MIRNKYKLDEFCRKLDAEENLSYKEALRIYETLHKEAVSLGAVGSENILEGIEVDLRIARAINGLNRARKTKKKIAQRLIGCPYLLHLSLKETLSFISSRAVR